MPQGNFIVARLRWIDRKGGCQMRQGNAAILAKRLETLRCEAKLELLDGTIIGKCERTTFETDDKRIKWVWWYEKNKLQETPKKCICLSSSEPQHHQRECPVYRQWKDGANGTSA